MAEDRRPISRTSPRTCQKIKYISRSDTLGSCPTADHRWSAAQPRVSAPHTRQTQTYNGGIGNRFTVDFDPGNGQPRTEDVTVSYQDLAPGGAIPYHFAVKVPVEAIYDVTVSALQFALINDCDFDLAGLTPQDSEPEIHWFDERGEHKAGFSMRGGQTRTATTFARSLSGITAKDGYQLPWVGWFVENDVPIPVGGFQALPEYQPSPLVPAVTHTVNEHDHAVMDNFCNASWSYTITDQLETFPAL